MQWETFLCAFLGSQAHEIVSWCSVSICPGSQRLSKEWSVGDPKRNMLYFSGAKYSLWTSRVSINGCGSQPADPKPGTRSILFTLQWLNQSVRPALTPIFDAIDSLLRALLAPVHTAAPVRAIPNSQRLKNPSYSTIPLEAPSVGEGHYPAPCANAGSTSLRVQAVLHCVKLRREALMASRSDDGTCSNRPWVGRTSFCRTKESRWYI